MNKIITVALALVGFAATPAHAGLAANGLATNGVKYNGFQLNGLQLNGLQLNGVKQNGIQINGTRINGRQYNGDQVTTFGMGGTSADRSRRAGMSPAARAVRHLVVSAPEAPPTVAVRSIVLLSGERFTTDF